MISKTIEETLRWGRETLRSQGIENFPLDARLLLQFVLQISKEDMMTSPMQKVSVNEFDMYANFIEKRCEGTPVAKIIGHKEFYGLVFKVSGDVLDPRPETELLVTKALAHFKGREKEPHSILELGVGSGCVIVSLLKHLPYAKAVAVDISPRALRVAKTNAEEHGVADRIQFVKSNWFEGLDDGFFDLIVSNPPYIATGDLDSLGREVKNFDPILALDGGEDGLDAYRVIFSSLNQRIHPQALVLLEIGYNQWEQIQGLAKTYGFAQIQVFRDLAGYQRVVSISTRKS